MRGVAGRLQQVVWNLVDNAAKFTNTRGHIHVSLRSRASDLVFSVADTGIGLLPNFMP